MMYLKQLERVGFTPREIRVYMALLELGESPVGKIIKQSGIPSSKIYETLDKLKSKGLASSVTKNNKYYFLASSPDTILDHLDHQRRMITEDVVPQLKSLQTKDKITRTVTLYEGIRALKSIYDLMLRTLHKGDTIYAMGVPLRVQELLYNHLQQFTKKRVKAGIWLKIIYEREARSYGETRKKAGYTLVRYMKKDSLTPTWVDIFTDYVVLFEIGDSPRAVLIKDPDMAESFKHYFTFIWKQSDR